MATKAPVIDPHSVVIIKAADLSPSKNGNARPEPAKSQCCGGKCCKKQDPKTSLA